MASKKYARLLKPQKSKKKTRTRRTRRMICLLLWVVADCIVAKFVCRGGEVQMGKKL